MSAKKLTKLEKEWLNSFQELMNNCPSKRFRAFTTGNFNITIYDKNVFIKHRDEIEKTSNYCIDDITIHEQSESILYEVVMPFQVDGISG